MPLVLNVGASCGTKEDGGNSEEEARERRLKIRWNEETRKKYKENTETGEWKEEGSIEEKWQKLKEIVQEALVKKEIVIKKKRLGHKDWWDRSYTKMKRRMKRILRKWKKRNGNREKYLQARKEWNEHIYKKQKERKAEKEMELKNLKNCAEVWEYINRRRKRKEIIVNRITKEEWKDHFLKLLDGKEKGKGEAE